MQTSNVNQHIPIESERACVVTVAGTDSAGMAGLQIDSHVQRIMGVHSLGIVSAVTAQTNHAVCAVEATSLESLQDQFDAVHEMSLPVSIIKTGLIANRLQWDCVLDQIAQHQMTWVWDPVAVASSGDMLCLESPTDSQLARALSLGPIVTPNLNELATLTSSSVTSIADIQNAAKILIEKGARAVFVKGGHAPETNRQWIDDFYLAYNDSFWLSSPKQVQTHSRGTGCAVASVIAACLARDYCLADAVVIAKMAINQGLRQGYGLKASATRQCGPAMISDFPSSQCDLPYLHRSWQADPAYYAFPSCNKTPLGLYPIVDSSEWVERLLKCGVTTIQLRVKCLPQERVEQEIIKSIDVATQYGARLFINDYWQLAIRHNAYGVHLGQEDLETADISAIHSAGLRLGISTHCHYEVARAHALSPSYIACGPIFPTTTKDMPWLAHNISGLAYWTRVLDYPVVAIGGINPQRLASVIHSKVSGISMISAITKADNPETVTRDTIAELNRYKVGKKHPVSLGSELL